MKGGGIMATKITERKPNFKNQRSHALNTSKKKQSLNLQTVTLSDGTRIKASAKELRTLKNKGIL